VIERPSAREIEIKDCPAMYITLENDSLLAVLSTEGGALERIFNKKTNNEHIWKYDKSEWARRTSVCFPICGRLLENEYIIDSIMYSLPMHGFLREKNLDILSQTGSSAVLQCRSDDITLRSYPFAFTLTLAVELVGNQLGIVYEVRNETARTMYYSIGSHYTFKVPLSGKETLADYFFDLQHIQNAGRLLYTDGFVSGKSDDFFRGRSRLDLQGLFENGSVAFELKDLRGSQFILKSRRSPFQTAVSMKNFSHLVLWAPSPTASFVCIEAWAGIPDTVDHNKILSEKKGILSLAAGGVCRHEQQIEIV